MAGNIGKQQQDRLENLSENKGLPAGVIGKIPLLFSIGSISYL